MFRSSSLRILSHRELSRPSSQCGASKQSIHSLLLSLTRISDGIKRRPLLFGSTFAAVKCGMFLWCIVLLFDNISYHHCLLMFRRSVLADAIIQKYVENKRLKDLNWRRSAVFFLFGLGMCYRFRFKYLFRSTFLSIELTFCLKDIPDWSITLCTASSIRCSSISEIRVSWWRVKSPLIP